LTASRYRSSLTRVYGQLERYYIYNGYFIVKMAVESPPLWIWVVILAVIIAAKFTYRWYATKQLAKHSHGK